MINDENKCLCDTCEFARFRTIKTEKGEELRGFDCPYSDEHIYHITKCAHYSNPGPLQRFFRNKLAVICTTLILISIVVFLCVMFVK